METPFISPISAHACWLIRTSARASPQPARDACARATRQPLLRSVSCLSTMPSFTITRHSDPPTGWGELAREVGTFYHDPRWIAGLAECFGYRPHWLTTQDAKGDRIAGGLAVAEVPGLVGGMRLVSYPF